VKKATGVERRRFIVKAGGVLAAAGAATIVEAPNVIVTLQRAAKIWSDKSSRPRKDRADDGRLSKNFESSEQLKRIPVKTKPKVYETNPSFLSCA